LSTILDALRKVEREAAQRPQPPGPLPDYSLARVLAEKRNRRVFRRLLVVITVLSLAGTGVAITIGRGLISSKDSSKNIAPVPKIAAVPRKDKVIDSPSVPVRQKEEAPSLKIAVNKPTPEPERLVRKEEPVPPPPGDETALPLAGKALRRTPPRIPTRSTPQVDAGRSEPIIPDLELQAIVWSDTPKTCFAMINGRLVRTGDEVGGFTVDEIGSNYVFVKSGLRSGRLRMLGAR
jgi:hypothetical protein